MGARWPTSSLIIGGLTVAALWGLAPVVQKALLVHLPRQTIFALSTLVYATSAVIYCCFHRQVILQSLPEVTGHQATLIILAAFLGSFAANLLFLEVLKDNPSYVVTALAFTSPIFTVALAASLLGEKIKWTNVFGILLVVCGAVLVVL
ncbi:MAG: hypothetical protein WDW38_006635 [Sanguina aurantia]